MVIHVELLRPGTAPNSVDKLTRPLTYQLFSRTLSGFSHVIKYATKAHYIWLFNNFELNPRIITRKYRTQAVMTIAVQNHTAIKPDAHPVSTLFIASTHRYYASRSTREPICITLILYRLGKRRYPRDNTEQIKQNEQPWGRPHWFHSTKNSQLKFQHTNSHLGQETSYNPATDSQHPEAQ